MPNRRTIEYPALIYKRNSVFVADCVMFKLASFGRTEAEAVRNLENTMNKTIPGFSIFIKPVYQERYSKTN